MKKLIAMLALVLGLATTAAVASTPERLLLILTSAEVETQAMALVLSNQAAVMLCGPAGDIATRQPPGAGRQGRDAHRHGRVLLDRRRGLRRRHLG